MHIVFFSTCDVFKAEEILINNNTVCKIVPTPTQDKAYCGVCIETELDSVPEALNEMEFEVLP